MERTQLSRARQKKFWTLEEAAERLNIDKSTLQRWEKGTSSPQPINLQKLCNIYDATLAELGFAEPCNDASIQHIVEEDTLLFQKQDLTLRLMRIVWQWNPHRTNYDALQLQVVQELESNMSHDTQEFITRRDALRRLALLPIEMSGLSLLSPSLKSPTEEVLAQCAAGMTACWYLRRGKDLAFASDIVSRYIPSLKFITQSSATSQRKSAADLLAQCFLLKALLAWHVEGSSEAVLYAQQATIYGEIAGDITMQTLALRTQAAAHYYANRWEQALSAAEQARVVLETNQTASIPPIARSYIYGGLATYQAHAGHQQEALRSLDKAYVSFFAQAPDEPAPIWIDHYKANLILHDGMTHFYLGLHKKALDSFEQIHLAPFKTETLRVEAFLNQMMAEINRDDEERDMEWCIDRWIQGIEGAKALQSEQRFAEAITAYAAMRAVWPGEQRVKELRDRIIHW